MYKRQDQENDYKITHLADSFEEFIRGLEHESLYDPDEDVEELEDDADEEETDRKGSFAGSVLLSKAEWDKEQLIRDLREEWGIVDEAVSYTHLDVYKRQPSTYTAVEIQLDWAEQRVLETTLFPLCLLYTSSAWSPSFAQIW